MGLSQRLGLDWATFGRRQTWIAFAISILLFGGISVAALQLFDVATSLQTTDDDTELQRLPDFHVKTLNRTGIDGSDELNLSDLRGSVVVLELTAVKCAGCKFVAAHIKQQQASYEGLRNTYDVRIVSVSVWLDESFESINETFGDPASNEHLPWPVGVAADDSIPGGEERFADAYQTAAIPVYMVVDHEGYMVFRGVGGQAGKDFSDLDDAVEEASRGQGDRISLRDLPIFAVGLLVGVLVFFSPCAFPVLPSYISYYLGLRVREDELVESGKLEGGLPGSWLFGILAAVGMLTFFAVLGAGVYGLANIIDITRYVEIIAYIVAVVLLILGFFMLVGGTLSLFAFVQRWIDKYSTTEMDDRFTPRRNIYLYGVGYAAASVDCTAAIVLPFIAALTISGADAQVLQGLLGMLISIVAMMMLVTILIGLGKRMLVQRIAQMTGMIKMAGAWMMMFAGIGLIYLLASATIAISTA